MFARINFFVKASKIFRIKITNKFDQLFLFTFFCSEIGEMAHRVNRKLIDFLDPRLSENCKIYTNGVSDDHCTLDNLISTDAEKRSRGFMAYSASHPPIEITLEFSWKINLKMIKVS